MRIGKNEKIFGTGLILLFCLLIPSGVKADLWKCGQMYTNSPAPEANCNPVKVSRVCGSDGNRYLASSKTAVPRDDGACNFEGTARSPVVNLAKAQALVDWYKQNEPRILASRSRTRQAQEKLNQKSTAFELPEGVEMPKDLSDVLGKGGNLGCIMSALSEGKDMGSCLIGEDFSTQFNKVAEALGGK